MYYYDFENEPELKGMTVNDAIMEDTIHYNSGNPEGTSAFGAMLFSEEMLKKFRKVRMSQIDSTGELNDAINRGIAEISTFEW